MRSELRRAVDPALLQRFMERARGCDLDDEAALTAAWAMAIHFHAHVPLVRLVLSGPARAAGLQVEIGPRHALADVARDLAPSREGALHRLCFGAGERGAPAVFDIDADPRPRGELRVDWDPEAAGWLDAQVLLDVFARLLLVVVDPRQPLEAIALVAGAPEPLQGPRRSYDREATLPRLLWARAAAEPERTAFSIGATRLTYGALVDQAAAVAHHLRREGVRPGDAVGVIAERSLALPVALYGIMAAGGHYVPLDPASPARRRREMIAMAGVSRVLDPRTAPAAADLELGVPSARVLDTITSSEPQSPLPQGSASDLCYVIFTSGSTGRPKGVMVEHRAVINRLTWMQGRYPLQPADVILHKTPAVFDVSVWELFWWAGAGASMHLMEPAQERFPLAVAAAVERAQVTVLHFIPSLLDLFLDWVATHPRSIAQLASLRQVFASGEALSSATVRRFYALLGDGGARLSNLYGPTEATVDVTAWDCPRQAIPPRIPIGRPIDNTHAYLLRHGRPVPPGVPATLLVGGDCVARGYVGAAAETAAAFLPDPGDPAARAYDTGDVVRLAPDGELEFLGRRDPQLKIMGMRLEPEEIEAVLRERAEVVECAVVASSRSTNLTVLIAYVVVREAFSEHALRAHLAQRVPRYMVPALWAPTTSLPRTPSGKIDRRRLAEPSYYDDNVQVP